MRRGGLACLLALTCLGSGCQQAAQSHVGKAVVRPAVEADPIVDVDLPPIFKPRYEPPDPPPLVLPDGSRTLFPGHRVVAFYGVAGAAGLGVLGTGSPEAVWSRLANQAAPYATRHAVALPSYELIAYLATGSRGNQGNYSSRLPDRTIDRYARAAKRHHGLLILDIQPGRGDFLRDARSLRKWLRLPYVGLALDPEWQLYGGELPLSGIGHTNAGAINRVSWWLNQLAWKYRLPQKLLLVHEFTDDMVRDRQDLKSRKRLAMVFNVDGFGSRGAKVGKYVDFARDKRFLLGFKLFYDMDVNLLAPRDVLRLHPRPAVVEYE